MDEKFIKKLVTIGVIVFAVLVIGINSCSVIDPNERGIDVTLGQMQDIIIQPGLHFKAPFVTHTRKFKLEPKTYEVTFSVGNDGAITNYDLVTQQNEITSEVANAMLTRMSNYPIAINQTTITNWDWSEDFDRQIKETANRTQQVKQAEQEANIAAAQAQKKVKEAEANKQAAELDAQAAVAKAEGESKAKKIRADADAYEAKQIAANQQAYQKQWDYEIALEKAKRWNGKEVPDAAYIVPGTGAVVPLSVK